MLKNFLIYFVLFNSIQFLLIEINCQMAPFKPSKRYLHTATFIDNKLYILGGRDVSKTTVKAVGRDFFYLDFSVQFNTQELLWKDLSSTNVVPSHSNAVTVKGGVNNNTLFLYAIVSISDMALVYTFDSQSNSWSIPKISGGNTTRKNLLIGVIDFNGKMYLFSGQVSSNSYVNEMLILDTINLRWGKGSLVSAPSPRSEYGATLISNHSIIYMGGSNSASVNGLSLNEVYIYDTINDNWNVKITSGNIPSGRYGFTVALGLDGQRIIIFGGYTPGGPLKSEDSLYVLDLKNYSWYIPKISGIIPQSRIYHQSNIIGKYMVISFGTVSINVPAESDILLLDISNNEEYVWTTLFQPLVSNNKTPSSPSSPLSPSSSLSSDTSDKSSNNTPAMIGAIIGSLFGGSLLTFGGFFLYKWNKNKQKQKSAIETPGNDSYNNYNQGKMLPVINVNKNFSHGQEVIYDNRFINHENNKFEDSEINDGQEVISANNDQGSSVQNIDNDVIQHLKNEMIQVVKQEINNQLSNLNTTSNNHGQE